MQPLPPLTVELAQSRARAASRRVFVWMMAGYLLSFQVGMLFGWEVVNAQPKPRGSSSRTINTGPRKPSPPLPEGLPTAVMLFSVVFGLAHYFRARKSRPERLVEGLGKEAEEKALSKAELTRFKNLVEELGLAVGIRKVRPLVLDSADWNAFSIQDSKGESILGVTKGALENLSRAELEAVLAHEAANLLYGDARTRQTVAALGMVFTTLLKPFEGRTRAERRGGGGLAIFGLLPGILGTLLMRWLSALLSRERRLDADAGAVGLCKNPLALASALEKMAVKGRQEGGLPSSLAYLFFQSPRPGGLEEKSGALADLFTAHPPLALRLAQAKALEQGSALKEEDARTAVQQANQLVTRGPLAFLRARALERSPTWRLLFILACFPLAGLSALFWGLQVSKDFNAPLESLVELEGALDKAKAPDPGQQFTLKLIKFKATFEPTRTPHPCLWCGDFMKNVAYGDGVILWVRGEALARERSHHDEGTIRFYAMSDLARSYFDVRDQMTPADIARRRVYLALSALPFSLGLLYCFYLLFLGRSGGQKKA